MAAAEVIAGIRSFELRGVKRLTPELSVDHSIMDIMEDQQPHSVVELASRTNMPAETVELFLRFLAKYLFITYDEQRETAVMCADFLSLK
jgi:predicted transcriptional regulator